MGQRTAVIIQVVKETNEQVDSTVYGTYIQWGIGRIMPMYLMNVISYTFLKKEKIGSPLFDFHTTLENSKPNFDVFDIEDFKSVAEKYGNNNGFLVIKIEEGKFDKYYPKLTFAFMLGLEELYDIAYKKCKTESGIDKYIEKEYMSHFVTLKTYMKHTGGKYTKGEFTKMFNAFINYFKSYGMVQELVEI